MILRVPGAIIIGRHLWAIFGYRCQQAKGGDRAPWGPPMPKNIKMAANKIITPTIMPEIFTQRGMPG
jgi:hypothetical protein